MDHSKISVIDYVVFGLSLLIPVIIAIYFTFINKQKSNASFLLGDRALTAVPISFSLAVSYLSAVTITGELVQRINYKDLQDDN
jgi:Na+/proline symporter